MEQRECQFRNGTSKNKTFAPRRRGVTEKNIRRACRIHRRVTLRYIKTCPQSAQPREATPIAGNSPARTLRMEISLRKGRLKGGQQRPYAPRRGAPEVVSADGESSILTRTGGAMGSVFRKHV